MKILILIFVLPSIAFADCDQYCNAWNSPSADAQAICHSNCAIAKSVQNLAEAVNKNGK